MDHFGEWEPASKERVMQRGYRLALRKATGIWTLRTQHAFGGIEQCFVLRRGFVLSTAKQNLQELSLRLALASESALASKFEGGNAYAPGQAPSLFLATWVKDRTGGMVDMKMAGQLAHQWAGVRFSIRPDLRPSPEWCDPLEEKILAALAEPRRIEEIWQKTRAPKFRLITFLYTLKSVDALSMEGVCARPRPMSASEATARSTLGVSVWADTATIRRAYHRLAKSFHPDRQPGEDPAGHDTRASRFFEITQAYRLLTGTLERTLTSDDAVAAARHGDIFADVSGPTP